MGKTHYEPGFALALNKALSLCTSGDTLLLSPAAPSYDEYKNFVEKGTFFQTKTGSLSTPCP
jgi:UDP-N-acetylmuramoylalanine-D-glutamate ligase